MEKKSNFNLEKTRTTHFMIGFCIISGIVLSAFSYGTLDKIEDKTTKLYTSQDMIVQREDIVEPPKPQVIPPQTQVPKQDPAPEIDLNIDSILDKISKYGIDSLLKEEKDFLDSSSK